MKKKVEKQEVNFIPGPKKYLVKRQEAATQSPGGILIPDTGRERPMEGVILSTRDGGNYEFKDLVLFGKYDGIEVTVDGEDYLLLEEDQILGKRV